MTEVAAVVGLDGGMARRLKALACTAPLHDLDARKSRVEWAEADPYQMAEIGLHLIDQVTIAMDFDRGAGHDLVISRTAQFVASQAPDRDRAEHERVARWVLENLINVGTQDRGFETVYGTVGRDGTYQRRTWSFKLLVELVSADGEIYLRSTDEAINVLVGALDTDVESAQEAAETKLDSLIRRGRLSDAQTVAQEARLRTIQYAEQLRATLDATRRDVRSVDWETEVPGLIDRALTHIGQRYRAENAILINITTARDEADDPDRKRKAAELVEVVRECMDRHTQLQARLLTAGATFRSEQDRQQFSGHAERSMVDLFGHLLMPTLELPLAQAAPVTATFFRTGTGLTVPGVTRLLDIVYMLLAPPVERDGLGAELPDPELAPAEDLDVFTTEQWDEAERLLRLDGVPRRLSGMLAEARDIDPDLPHLIALRVLHAMDPEISTALRQGDTHALLTVDDGTALDDPEFGGADLLVGLASLDPAGHHEDSIAARADEAAKSTGGGAA